MNISKVKSIANLAIGDKVLVKNHVHDIPFEGIIKYIEKNNHSLVISINNGDAYLFPIEDQINNLQFMKSIKNIEYGFSFSLL